MPATQETLAQSLPAAMAILSYVGPGSGALNVVRAGVFALSKKMICG
jgi:hypothetical protein